MLSYRAEVYQAMGLFLLCKTTFNMFIEKQDTKGGTYFIFPYLCLAFKLKS